MTGAATRSSHWDFATLRFRSAAPITVLPPESTAPTPPTPGPVVIGEGATASTDFAGLALGSGVPAGFSAAWGDPANWEVVAEAAAPGGKVLRLNRGTTNSRRMLTWNAYDALPDRTQTEVCIVWRSATPATARVGVRLSGTSGSEAGGYVAGAGSDSLAGFTKYVNGAGSNTQVAQDLSGGGWFVTVEQDDGQAVRQKTYSLNVAEPTTWAPEIADTTMPVGKVGVFGFDKGATTDIAWLSVGTGKKAAPRPPAFPGATSTQPTPQSLSTITVRDITWTFSKAVLAGQFINGDWWVAPPSPDTTVTLNSVTPDPVAATSTSVSRHGITLNPTQAGHGYTTDLAGYDAALDKSAMPLTVSPGTSVIKAYNPDGFKHFSQGPDLLDAVVLTVLAEPPQDSAAGANTFRPPYAGPASGKKQLRWSQVRTDLLPSLAPPTSETGPTLEQVRRRYAYTQLDHKSNWRSRYLHPERAFLSFDQTSCSNYGSDLARDLFTGILRLMLNDTLTAKTPALIAVLQNGIDICGYIAAGGTLPADGGHGVGRKVGAVFAAVLFDDADLKAACTSGSFDEDKHLYRSTTINMVLWGRSSSVSGYQDWLAGLDNSKDRRDAEHQVVDGGKPGKLYQNCCTSKAYMGQALIARLLGDTGKALMGDLVLEYADRWKTHGAWSYDKSPAGVDYGRTYKSSSTDTTPDDLDIFHGINAGGGFYGSSFANAMWDTYRSTLGPISYVRRADA